MSKKKINKKLFILMLENDKETRIGFIVAQSKEEALFLLSKEHKDISNKNYTIAAHLHASIEYLLRSFHEYKFDNGFIVKELSK